MADLNTQQACEKLAAENPREFLYQVYRDGPYAVLDVIIPCDDNLKKISRRWALNPANDSIKTAFNIFARGQDRSLYRQLADYRKRTEAQFTVNDAKGWPQLKPQSITPAALIQNIEEILALAKAVIARGAFDRIEGQARLQHCCDICENALLPLLRAMPPHMSLADYPKPEKAKAALRQPLIR